MNLSGIFWQILGIFGEKYLILDEFLRFNRKISTLNNVFLGSKKVKFAIPRIFIRSGWHLWEGGLRISCTLGDQMPMLHV